MGRVYMLGERLTTLWYAISPFFLCTFVTLEQVYNRATGLLEEETIDPALAFSMKALYQT